MLREIIEGMSPFTSKDLYGGVEKLGKKYGISKIRIIDIANDEKLSPKQFRDLKYMEQVFNHYKDK